MVVAGFLTRKDKKILLYFPFISFYQCKLFGPAAGKTHLSVKPLAWSLHSALYRQRPDARCVLHLRTPQVIAVSVFKNGLLPASNDAVLCIHGAGVAVYLLDELLEPRAPATATTEQVREHESLASLNPNR